TRSERSLLGCLAPHDGRLAVAAIEEPAAGGLHPLRAARPALARAGEGPGDPTGGDAGLGAVGRRDLDRGVAALALARVNPAGVAPTRILRRTCHRRRGEQRQDCENCVTHARAHPRCSLPVRDSTSRRAFGTNVLARPPPRSRMWLWCAAPGSPEPGDVGISRRLRAPASRRAW